MPGRPHLEKGRAMILGIHIGTRALALLSSFEELVADMQGSVKVLSGHLCLATPAAFSKALSPQVAWRRPHGNAL